MRLETVPVEPSPLVGRTRTGVPRNSDLREPPVLQELSTDEFRTFKKFLPT